MLPVIMMRKEGHAKKPKPFHSSQTGQQHPPAFQLRPEGSNMRSPVVQCTLADRSSYTQRPTTAKLQCSTNGRRSTPPSPALCTMQPACGPHYTKGGFEGAQTNQTFRWSEKGSRSRGLPAGSDRRPGASCAFRSIVRHGLWPERGRQATRTAWRCAE
jgi:hypothetical protein